MSRPETKQQSKQLVEAADSVVASVWVCFGIWLGQLTCSQCNRKIARFEYDLLDLPPYSPQMAPSDFRIFPHLKKFVSVRLLAPNEKVEKAVDEYLLLFLHLSFEFCIIKPTWFLSENRTFMINICDTNLRIVCLNTIFCFKVGLSLLDVNRALKMLDLK